MWPPAACRHARALAAALAVAVGASLSGAEVSDQGRLLDSFERLGAWTADASDGVKASARSTAGAEDTPCASISISDAPPATRSCVASYRSICQRTTRSSFLPAGNAPINNFEVKLADASGDNVWWFQRRDFVFPTEWRRIKIKKRQIAFAWGPTQDRTLRHVDSLEFVVAAGAAAATAR